MEKFQCTLISLLCLFLGHTSKVLNISANEHSEEVCNGDTPKICCHFHLKTKTASDIPKDKNIYTYHLAAFSGLTHYTNTIHGGIEACALLACLNDSVTSCGRRYVMFFVPQKFQQNIVLGSQISLIYHGLLRLSI